MGKNRPEVEESYEESKERFVRERGWYVPALHERYIEMRGGYGKRQAKGQ